MVKEILENGDKVVKIAEDIQYSGIITTIISILFLSIICVYIFWDHKERKQNISTMKLIGHATKEMAESIRTLVNESIKKDESSQRNIEDFNNVRRLHIEEIKRVTDMACSVDKSLEKVVVKQDMMDTKVNKILTILEVK